MQGEGQGSERRVGRMRCQQLSSAVGSDHGEWRSQATFLLAYDTNEFSTIGGLKREVLCTGHPRQEALLLKMREAKRKEPVD